MEGMHRSYAIDPGLVRTKAYELWQSKGCPDGADEQIWLEAERQLQSRPAQPQGSVASSGLPADRASAAPVKSEPLQSKPASEPPTSAKILSNKKTSSRRARR